MLRHQYEHIINGGIYVQYPDGQIKDSIDSRGRNIHIVPGSFRTLHNAHKALIYSAQSLGSTFAEISINRRGKDHLSFEEVKERISRFEWYVPVIIWNNPLFSEKTRILSSAGFRPFWHIGYDTASRLIEDHQIPTIESWTCTFHVYPRGLDGKIHNIKDLGTVPMNFIPCDYNPKNKSVYFEASSNEYPVS